MKDKVMTYLRLLLPGLALVALALALGTATASMQDPQLPEWPKLRASASPAAEDVKAIEAIIEKSYDITGWAARNFDVSQFSTVFANDPAIPLSDEAVDYLVLKGATSASAARTFGFLGYKLAFFGNWKLDAEAIELLQRQAEADGRLITAEELASISKGGQVPAPRRTDPMYKTNVKVEQVNIDGIRAEVTFDDGGITYLTAMLKTVDGWRIVGQRVLDIHV